MFGHGCRGRDSDHENHFPIGKPSRKARYGRATPAEAMIHRFGDVIFGQGCPKMTKGPSLSGSAPFLLPHRGGRGPGRLTYRRNIAIS
jgi:hypothetical protein